MIYVLSDSGDIIAIIDVNIQTATLVSYIHEYNRIVEPMEPDEFDDYPCFVEWLRKEKHLEVKDVDYTQVSTADGYVY